MLEENEYIEKLKRNTPKAVRHVGLDWMIPYNCPDVFVLFLGYQIPVSQSDIENMADYELEAHIKRTLLMVFRDAITKINSE